MSIRLISIVAIQLVGLACVAGRNITTATPERPGLYGSISSWNGGTDDINGEVGHRLFVSGPRASCRPSGSWTANHSIIGGQLPPGLSVGQGFDIEGIPTEPGHWIVRVKLQNIQCEGMYFDECCAFEQELRFHITGSGKVIVESGAATETRQGTAVETASQPEAPSSFKEQHTLQTSSQASGLYQLERAIDFNVLDNVFLSPGTGQITLIGHADPRYGGLRIPYLQHLAALLENPQPQFSLNWTPESEQGVEQLFRRMDSEQEVRNMASRWGYWIDESQQVTTAGRFFMPIFGVTPSNDRYQVVASILRANGNTKGAEIIDKAGIAMRLMNSSGFDQALQDLVAATGALDALYRFKAQVERGEISDFEGQTRFGLAVCAGMEDAFGLTNRPISQTFDQAMRRSMDLGQAFTEAFRELDNQLRTILGIAMESLLSRYDEIAVPPEVIQETLGIRPEVTPEYSGVEGRSQLARVMFESDYIAKQILNRPDLQGKIPGYKTDFAFERDNPGRAVFKPTSRHHLWISVEKLDAAQSADGYTLQTRGATMRFNIREKIGNRSMPLAPGGYEQGYEQLLTSIYDELTVQFPVLHELREVAKLKAAADWLKTRRSGIQLPAAGRAMWDGPPKIPGLVYMTWTPRPRPGAVTASMMAMGGIDLVYPPPNIPFDASLPDLRNSSLTTLPWAFDPAGLGKSQSTQVPLPHPLGWLTTDVVGTQIVTAVSIRPDLIERDAPADVALRQHPEEEAAALWRVNDLEEAAEAYGRALEDPSLDARQRALLRMKLSQVLREKGDNAAAIREFNEAVRIAPDLPIIQLIYAKHLFDVGDARGAEEALRKYLTLDPKNNAAAKLLTELQEREKQGVPAPASSSSPTDVRSSGKTIDRLRTLKAFEAAVSAEGEAGSATAQLGFDIPVADTTSPSTGDVVAGSRPTEEREVPASLVNKPEFQRLKAVRDGALEEYKKFEQKLKDIDDKIKRGEGNPGELAVEKAKTRDEMSREKSKADTAKIEMDFIVDWAEKEEQKSSGGQQAPKTKPNPTPNKPSSGGQKKP